MSIEVSDEIQRIIDKAMNTGPYLNPEDVLSAAMRSLAEDWDDLGAVHERAAEKRIALEDVESELCSEGFLG